jgi:predicted N-acetyltransferase YhbS
VGDLERRGWRPDRSGVTDCSAPADLPWPVLDEVLIAGEDDLIDVRQVLDRAFGDESSAEFLPEGITAAPGVRLLLHREAGEPVGAIGMRLRDESALLFALGVVPAARRRGLALGLVGAAAREVRRAGRTSVQVQAEGPSLGFWSAAGFEAGARWRSFTPST